MKKLELRLKKSDATCYLQWAESLDELIEQYGELTVLHCAQENIKARARISMTNLLNNGRTPEEAKKEMEECWQPLKRIKRTLKPTVKEIRAALDL